ncbi:hypothetical protein JB92DRAFT_2204665 [Gautieria morchelliformis]|nr:hypothetical protein JB92DRAFT_2204665 [Gautieria morchelliformis]
MNCPHGVTCPLRVPAAFGFLNSGSWLRVPSFRVLATALLAFLLLILATCRCASVVTRRLALDASIDRLSAASVEAVTCSCERAARRRGPRPLCRCVLWNVRIWPYSDDSCQDLPTPTRSLHNPRTRLNAISTQLDPAIRDSVLSLRLLGVRSPRERVTHRSCLEFKSVKEDKECPHGRGSDGADQRWRERGTMNKA